MDSEQEKTRSSYFRALIEIKKCVKLGNTDKLKKVGRILIILSKKDNVEWLKSLHYDNSNPLQETSLIILACKYDQIEVLKYLFDDQNKLLHNVSTSIGRVMLKPGDQDEEGHTAFYYAIRENNVELVDMLANKWPGNYFSNPVHSYELHDLLSKAFEELKIRNVPLSKQMEVFIESKLIEQRFFHVSIYKNNRHQNIRTTLITVKERIDLVLENIRLLETDYLGAKEEDGKFFS